MNQLTLFDALPVPPVRATRPVLKRADIAGDVPARWAVGMVVSLPLTAGIQGERWRQYTTGLSGRIEMIEGDLAGVRIASAGHKFDGKLAVAHLAALSANN